jgi:hypothetical protein
MAVRNIARGGGKAYKAEVTGLKELERKLKALSVDNPQLRNDIFGVVGDAADELRDEMKSAARGAGWGAQSIRFRGPRRSGVMRGEDAINSIFAYAKPRGGDFRKRISALAGVSKQKTLIEWRAGKFPKSPNAKIAPGGAVAESLAAMLEFGTSNHPARPAIRGVIRGQKAKMIDAITTGYNALLEKYSK